VIIPIYENILKLFRLDLKIVKLFKAAEAIRTECITWWKTCIRCRAQNLSGK